MKRFSPGVAALALSALVSANPALAEDGGKPGVYLGVVAGNNMVDLSGLPVTVDDANSTGVLLGFRANDMIGFELTNGDSEHDFSGLPCVMEVSTMAIYGALRTPGVAYLKAKMGLLNEEVSASCIGMSVSDTGMSYGFGGGVRIGKNAGIEVEYTLIEADISRLSLAALYNF